MPKKTGDRLKDRALFWHFKERQIKCQRRIYIHSSVQQCLLFPVPEPVHLQIFANIGYLVFFPEKAELGKM